MPAGDGGPHPVTGRLPPQRHSVRDQVLAALREALLSGELAPGEVYSAPALAARHGVSPTPVREAMQRLASEGLVETVPNRGFRVTEHTARDAAELAEVRALLEIPTVRALARTLPAERWDELRPLADATMAAAVRGDRSGYAEADRAFHLALLELHGNHRLTLLAETVLRHAQCPVAGVGTGRTGAGRPGRAGGVAAAGAGGRAVAARLVPAAAEHVALLDALRSRDPAAAERVLRAHLGPR
ncbi:GntR family transcriptional regulator [Streptomyces sp. JJ36]|uniref:GntR family transcriptional regulator n=1 Tax=Streptomyces sp. JJ36 TaxID=2736645 RepID=UPI001F2B5292|nr:GntR family transcriptional regulator [Streptomyces sp. JJ36]